MEQFVSWLCFLEWFYFLFIKFTSIFVLDFWSYYFWYVLFFAFLSPHTYFLFFVMKHYIFIFFLILHKSWECTFMTLWIRSIPQLLLHWELGIDICQLKTTWKKPSVFPTVGRSFWKSSVVLEGNELWSQRTGFATL